MTGTLRALRERGARRLAKGAVRRVRRLWLDADHVWLDLVLDGERPRPALPDGVRLVAGGESDLERLTRHVLSGPRALARYRAEGGRPWLALEGDEVLFSCWTFPARMPAICGPGGWVEAAPGLAFLEESVTSPQARGRGIAAAAWTAVADRVAETGAARLRTVIDPRNAAVRAALTKAGFVPVATTHTRRRGPRKRVDIEVLDEAGASLEAALRRGR